MSVKAEVLPHCTKRKGNRRQETVPSYSGERRFIQVLFFYLQIHIAERRKKRTLGQGAWGVVRHSSRTPAVFVHPDTPVDLTWAMCWRTASYIS